MSQALDVAELVYRHQLALRAVQFPGGVQVPVEGNLTAGTDLRPADRRPVRLAGTGRGGNHNGRRARGEREGWRRASVIPGGHRVRRGSAVASAPGGVLDPDTGADVA